MLTFGKTVLVLMLCLILTPILFCAIVLAGTRNAYLDSFCKQQINETYELHVPPKNEAEPGKPLNVFVKIKVIDIDEIDGAHMDFRLHMYFTTSWNDTRLRRSNNLTTDCSDYVWTPDVMFETAKSVQVFHTTSTSLRISTSGAVSMTDRYSFKATCWMNFRYYPFDTQECLFSIVFMSTTDTIALLKWYDDASSPFSAKPIEFSREMEPLQYYIQSPTLQSKTVHAYSNYTYLIANFPLVRRITGSIVSIYIPSTLVVAVSWVTFWLRPEAAPARVSLSITSLLTLCTQVQQYKAQLPPVNYITAMDVWLFVCIFVVFATLLEFAVCYNAYVGEKDFKLLGKLDKETQKSVSASQETKIYSLTEDKTDGNMTLGERIQNIIGQGGSKLSLCCLRLRDGERMDRNCRKYFPLSFLIFAIIYWTYYSIVS